MYDLTDCILLIFFTGHEIKVSMQNCHYRALKVSWNHQDLSSNDWCVKLWQDGLLTPVRVAFTKKNFVIFLTLNTDKDYYSSIECKGITIFSDTITTSPCKLMTLKFLHLINIYLNYLGKADVDIDFINNRIGKIYGFNYFM